MGTKLCLLLNYASVSFQSLYGTSFYSISNKLRKLNLVKYEGNANLQLPLHTNHHFRIFHRYPSTSSFTQQTCQSLIMMESNSAWVDSYGYLWNILKQLFVQRGNCKDVFSLYFNKLYYIFLYDHFIPP